MGSSDAQGQAVEKVPESGAASPLQLSCPAPLPAGARILLAHGGGGKMSQKLLETVFLPAFANPELLERHDGAFLKLRQWCPDTAIEQLAFTTDGHVVSPLFFEGGDIGRLAVFGTVNDLAMCGARPVALSAAFILEEGLEIATLQRVVQSMSLAAREVGVAIVTGDTKVVQRGKGDGIFVTTAGIGILDGNLVAPRPSRIEPGDVIIVSGDVGRHGMAILAGREGLAFETALVSDCASIVSPVMALMSAGLDIHCLRDLTRGGLVSALCELSESCQRSMRVHSQNIPVQDDVAAACEVLGLDPLSVACEGRFVCMLPRAHADAALAILRAHPVSLGARIVGEVLEEPRAWVRLKTVTGTERLLDMISGEQLPRIC